MFTGVTWTDYHNGICYDDAMVEVKRLLKDAIVVGHNIESDERALCFQILYCWRLRDSKAILRDAVQDVTMSQFLPLHQVNVESFNVVLDDEHVEEVMLALKSQTKRMMDSNELKTDRLTHPGLALLSSPHHWRAHFPQCQFTVRLRGQS